jgi:hypothetical protein
MIPTQHQRHGPRLSRVRHVLGDLRARAKDCGEVAGGFIALAGELRDLGPGVAVVVHLDAHVLEPL